ncbi:MAG: hypothetical protein Q7U40_13740, partial [Desulfatirhabdiaceae bacterium]|nr:hypothetical protein [Desulfatirhabdiaceae bacterium]
LNFPNPTYLVGAYRTDPIQSRALKLAALKIKPPAKYSFHYFSENCWFFIDQLDKMMIAWDKELPE